MAVKKKKSKPNSRGTLKTATSQGTGVATSAAGTSTSPTSNRSANGSANGSVGKSSSSSSSVPPPPLQSTFDLLKKSRERNNKDDSSYSPSEENQFISPLDKQNSFLLGLTVDEVTEQLARLPLDELDPRLEGYYNFSKQEVDDMAEKYADNLSLVFDLEHEATTMNFSEGLPLLKSYLRPDEYRELLSDLYYSLAEEAAYEDEVEERSQQKELVTEETASKAITVKEQLPRLRRPPFAGDALLTKAVRNAIASTLYDRVDQKHRNLPDIPSKSLFVDKDSGFPDNTMNMMLDRRRVMMDLELWFKLQLASARIDGLRAASVYLRDELEADNFYTKPDEDSVPLYEALYQSTKS